MRGATSQTTDSNHDFIFQSTRPMRGATLRRTSTAMTSLDFNPRAPCGARLRLFGREMVIYNDFNPRAPCGARLWVSPLCFWHLLISIHAPHAGRDFLRSTAIRSIWLFQSTRPMRGATSQTTDSNHDFIFQSTRPMRGATLRRTSTAMTSLDFNPRAPCGARQITLLEEICSRLFQSTRPMRGATPARRRSKRNRKFQSTRPMRGATVTDTRERLRLLFQSTRPMRGATQQHRSCERQERISIHAPHAGRDRERNPALLLGQNFNPRAPCGARLSTGSKGNAVLLFQSTRPMRGATSFLPDSLILIDISIHAPHAGRDAQNDTGDGENHISIHAPHAGRDLPRSRPDAQARDFNPRAPCGARR